MIKEFQDVNVQIIHNQNGKDYNIYPTSKDFNIIISENPLITLDEFIKKQVNLDNVYNEGIEKLKTIEEGAQKNAPSFTKVRVNDKPIVAKNIDDVLLLEIGKNLNCEVEDHTIRLDLKLLDNFVSEDRPGFMTPEMLDKLSGIEDNANNYSHPKSPVSPGTYNRVTVNSFGHIIDATPDQLTIAEGGTGARTLEEAKVNLEIPKPTLMKISEISDAPVASNELFRLFATKAEKEHGNHVPDSDKNGDQRFLREGNYWSEIWKGTEDNAGILMLTDNRESKEEYTAITPQAARTLFEDAKSFTVEKISELVGGAGEDYDTLVELQKFIEEHKDVMDGLFAILQTKVDKEEGKQLSTNDFNDTYLEKVLKAYEFSQEYVNIDHPEYNTIVEIQKNGTALPPDDNRVVNIIVPTKVSDIENDLKYLTEHPSIESQENTNNEITLSMGNSFTVIDDIKRDKNNHVITYNTKEITIPETATTTKSFITKVNGSEVLKFDGAIEKILKILSGENMTITIEEDGSIKFTPSYKEASIESNGLMPAKMFEKLQGIAENANNYTLPTAGKSLGGVKTTSNVEDVSYYSPTPIVSGIPYYKKSCVDVLPEDPVNPPVGYTWVVE